MSSAAQIFLFVSISIVMLLFIGGMAWIFYSWEKADKKTNKEIDRILNHL